MAGHLEMAYLRMLGLVIHFHLPMMLMLMSPHLPSFTHSAVHVLARLAASLFETRNDLQQVGDEADFKEMVLKKKRVILCLFLLELRQGFSDFYHDGFAPTPTVNEEWGFQAVVLFAICVFDGMKTTGVESIPVSRSSQASVCRFSQASLRSRLGVLEVNKTLDGHRLPESPQAFYNDVATVLLSNGYVYARAASDPCVFFKRQDDQLIIIWLLMSMTLPLLLQMMRSWSNSLMLRSRYMISVSNPLEPSSEFISSLVMMDQP
jgi:hypothetical protein